MARYWCKVCAAFVTDTVFERKVHEETAKHKSAWKQHLRGLYDTSKEESAKKDDLEREMEVIRAQVAKEGYGGVKEDKTETANTPVAPKKTFYEKVDTKTAEKEEKKTEIDKNTGTGVWESVQVLPAAAAPVHDTSESSEYVLSASKRAQRVNDRESSRWKIEEKQIDDDDLVLNKKRKLGTDREGIKVELKQEEGVKQEEPVKEEKDEAKGGLFKRKKKKVKG